MQNMDDAVSHFITGTCHLVPKVCLTTLHNLIFDIALKESNISLKFCTIGSAVEFFIQPIHQDVRNIDVMLYSDENVAVEEITSSLISKLLTEYSDSITCYELEPYIHLPGYVRMRLTGILVYDWDSNRYNFHKQEFSQFLSNDVGGEQRKESPRKLLREHTPQHATSDLMPAFSEEVFEENSMKSERYDMADFSGNVGIGNTNETNLDTTSMSNLLLMLVQCRIPRHVIHSVRCPIWPKEALSWRFRPRTSGWPSRELIEEVVQTGCDIVPGRHPLCEEPELLWRVSFARPEAVLLVQWTPAQQIVYHMLRYFARRNLMQKDFRQQNDFLPTDFRQEPDFLTTYHLKTLMLWSCENQSPDWWTSSNLLVICSRLLSVLYKWLRQNDCPHYFIPNCNLFNCLLNSETRHQVLRTLEPFQETSQLSQWFFQNYVFRIHRKLCNSAEAKMNLSALEHTMLLASTLAKQQMLEELMYWIVMVSSAFRLTLSNFDHVELQRKFTGSKSEHDKMDCFPEFTQYFESLNLLHLVGFITCGTGLRNEYKIFEVVAEIFKKELLQNVHKYPLSYVDFLTAGEVYYIKSLELMSTITGQETSVEFDLLAKLSIKCLQASLNLQAPDMNRNYCSSVGYLAALHHGIGLYEVAARLGSWLDFRMSAEITSHARLNGFLMMYIVDVSNILGFLQLVKRVARHRITYDIHIATEATFAVELFGKYLRLQCGTYNTQELLRETIPKNWKWSLADHGLFSIMQYKLTQCFYKTTVGSMKTKTIIYSRSSGRCSSLNECYVSTDIELAELMTECALDRLEFFFESVSKHFDFRCNTARCYRALYLYSRCKYKEVLALCEQLIREEFSPLLEMKSPCFAVTVAPPFDKFYDADIQALLGFAYLFDMCYSERSNATSIVDLPVFGYSRYKTKLVVLEMKKKTFITGRFLANYLKIRCLIDTKSSLKEIAEVYRELKSRLPLEHIVRHFVLRNLLCRYNIIINSNAVQCRNVELKAEIKQFPTVLHVDL